jgi:hypothetical protein
MNFIADLRAEIFAELPHKPADRAKLEALDTGSLLVAYWNWMNRGPSRYAYTVHRSDSLSANRLFCLED